MFGNDAYQDSYAGYQVAANAAAEDRAAFIKNTYLHLAGAVLCFAGLEVVIQVSGLAAAITNVLYGMGWVGIGLFFLVMMGVPMITGKLSSPDQPAASQYMGLGLYVLMYAVLFAPILMVATQFPQYAGKNIVMQSVIVTLAAFCALSAVAFITKADFSFLRGILVVATFMAMGLIVASMIFGFSLGLVFVVAMIALACGYILYDTGNIIHHYPTNAHVAASLALFGALATLFYYVLRLAMILADRD